MIYFTRLADIVAKYTALYEHLLGLQSTWSVKFVDLSLTG